MTGSEKRRFYPWRPVVPAATGFSLAKTTLAKAFADDNVAALLAVEGRSQI
jgi:hypothetical protein